MLCNYGPHPHQDSSLGTYSMVIGGGGSGSKQPPSLPPHNTHNTGARIPTFLHTTTHNRATTLVYNKITNVPVVYMALILNGFEARNIITRGIGRGGP
jgi:hypothetical protein